MHNEVPVLVQERMRMQSWKDGEDEDVPRQQQRRNDDMQESVRHA